MHANSQPKLNPKVKHPYIGNLPLVFYGVQTLAPEEDATEKLAECQNYRVHLNIVRAFRRPMPMSESGTVDDWEKFGIQYVLAKTLPRLAVHLIQTRAVLDSEITPWAKGDTTPRPSGAGQPATPARLTAGSAPLRSKWLPSPRLPLLSI